MFKRDEVYDLLVQLTGQAMQRWLKNAGGDAPGQSNDANFMANEVNNQRNLQDIARLSDSRQHQLVSPLIHDLAAQKRNKAYCSRFRLPINESLISGLDATYTKSASSERDQSFLSQVPSENIKLIGRVYISQTFLAFESQDRLPAPQQHLPVCMAVFPLYTIKRVERINQGSYTSGVSITTWHKMEHVFKLHVSKPYKSNLQFLLIFLYCKNEG
jgi:hypothetical protein